MSILINLFSYNRKEMLLNLIDSLKDHKIVIWDDCSDFDLKDISGFYRFGKNYGKKLAWLKFKKIFNSLKLTNYEYYIFLPDDVELCDDFVSKAVELWDSIDDPRKACLSFSHPDRCLKPNFTGIKSVDCGGVIRSQWTDLMFICGKNFINEVDIEEIPLSRWEDNELLGSGVGSQISNKLVDKGFNLYNVKDNLVVHLGNYNSKMNTEERKINKL
jgi:hypothetical protein